MFTPTGETMLLCQRKLVAKQLQVNMALARRKRRQRCFCSQLELRRALPSRRTLAPRCPINYLSAFAFPYEIFSPLPRELGRAWGQGRGQAHGAAGAYPVRGEESLGKVEITLGWRRCWIWPLCHK